VRDKSNHLSWDFTTKILSDLQHRTVITNNSYLNQKIADLVITTLRVSDTARTPGFPEFKKSVTDIFNQMTIDQSIVNKRVYNLDEIKLLRDKIGVLP